MGNLASFWKTIACGRKGLPDKSIQIEQILAENAKVKNIAMMWRLRDFLRFIIIASEVCYILSGQMFLKNAINGEFGNFRKSKLVVEKCYQTIFDVKSKNLIENQFCHKTDKSLILDTKNLISHFFWIWYFLTVCFMTLIYVVQQVLTLANFDLVNFMMDDLRGIIR